MAIIRIFTVQEFDTETGRLVSSKQYAEMDEPSAKNAQPKKSEATGEATVTVSDNTVALSAKAAELIGAVAGDKVNISYLCEDEIFYPVIAKVSADHEGKKLTKKLTISYKGKQSEILKNYGTEFTLSSVSPNEARMVSKTNPEIEQIKDSELEPETNEDVIDFDFNF
jgi:hypothetical protein